MLRRWFRAFAFVIGVVLAFVGVVPPEGWPYAVAVGLVVGVAMLLTRKPSKGFNGLRRPHLEI